ncbi:uncharacterized protein HKW66_Vig0187390 [Vigna angularis]|uniref:Uncharacterized protein n=1 Tax=Phaseolus angularis TaxID=3914 RepID=A0A8T0KWC4_PHAAN|nr:uncharacterized protein HKW66_Vig0187390 [Vigna angularis]
MVITMDGDEVERDGDDEMDSEGDHEVKIDSGCASEDDDEIDDVGIMDVGLVDVHVNVVSGVENIVERNVIIELLDSRVKSVHFNSAEPDWNPERRH